jgi:hypothetical protein
LFYGVDSIDGNMPYNSPVVIFGGFRSYNMTEIRENPFPYLLSIAFVFSLLGAYWTTIMAPKHKRHSKLQILVIPWVAVILTGPIWGLIWSVNRWPPGSFTDSDVMMLFYKHDAIDGLNLSWLSAIFSFPINILSYVTVCGLLIVSKRLFKTSIFNRPNDSIGQDSAQPPLAPDDGDSAGKIELSAS